MTARALLLNSITLQRWMDLCHSCLLCTCSIQVHKFQDCHGSQWAEVTSCWLVDLEHSCTVTAGGHGVGEVAESFSGAQSVCPALHLSLLIAVEFDLLRMGDYSTIDCRSSTNEYHQHSKHQHNKRDDPLHPWESTLFLGELKVDCCWEDKHKACINQAAL